DVGPEVPVKVERGEARRWVTVAVTDVSVSPAALADAATELWIESPSGAVRVDDARGPKRVVAAIAAGDAIRLRLRGPRRGAVVAQAVIPPDARGPIDVRAGGDLLARVAVEARALAAPKGAP